MEFGVILLAAGGSTRMGGEHKLLLPWGNGTVVGQALAGALGAPVSQVAVVTGCRADEVARACATGDERVRFRHNPRWAEGMYSSVREGLGALGTGVDAFFVALGDMPLVSARVYADFMQRYEEQPGRIYVPVWEGRRGHPVLFSAELGALDIPDGSDAGLRGLLRRYPERVAEVPAPDPGVCVDLDTPEEYARFAPK